ncbi:MAG TPA: FeoA family protein [Sphingopyxis sp.]|nr:FeoA family protein [Sphingopyxis sp.]HMP44788.1 FeoA family protein [Sphingopyxis sp.]HMQ18928.1 FeoA family protein [Sphingopyxis sp.]
MIGSLDSAPLGAAVRIARIDWPAMSPDEGRRLREFGLMEGALVTPLHRGSLFSRDPLALAVGRMRVIIRAAQAAVIAVEAVDAAGGAEPKPA